MQNSKSFSAIAGLLLILALPLSANAGDTKPADALSIQSIISDLLANPKAKAVVDKYMPGLSTSEHLSMIESMSLEDLSAIPQSNLDETKLKSIQQDLSQIK